MQGTGLLRDGRSKAPLCQEFKQRDREITVSQLNVGINSEAKAAGLADLDSNGDLDLFSLNGQGDGSQKELARII